VKPEKNCQAKLREATIVDGRKFCDRHRRMKRNRRNHVR